MSEERYIREKFTMVHTAARKHAKQYFERYPKDRYQTEVESWRELQSQNIEFTMKRPREPIEKATEIAK
jgi:ribosomal protein L32E